MHLNRDFHAGFTDECKMFSLKLHLTMKCLFRLHTQKSHKPNTKAKAHYSHILYIITFQYPIMVLLFQFLDHVEFYLLIFF